MMEDVRATGLPPQNLDAERSVLGALLLDNGCIPDVSEVLTPSDFYAPSHQQIYEGALELYEQSKPVDFITLGCSGRTRWRRSAGATTSCSSASRSREPAARSTTRSSFATVPACAGS
jgi:hypothetical protein